MPKLGLGVYDIPKGTTTEQAVLWALEAGYRLIDTASFYGNEADVGRALTKSGIPRNDIFITTKLWPTNFWRVEAAFEKSRTLLGVDRIDLYLIHWPSIGKGHAWKVLERLYTEQRIRAIGVSNYSVAQLETLRKHTIIVPAVNQVEFSPFCFRNELLQYCQAHGIQLEAYSPLTRGKKLHQPIIESLAASYHKTTAQLLIRWSLQHGLVVIPKTQHQERMIENKNVFDFEINQADMATLDALNENFHALFSR